MFIKNKRGVYINLTQVTEFAIVQDEESKRWYIAYWYNGDCDDMYQLPGTFTEKAEADLEILHILQTAGLYVNWVWDE